MKKILKWAVIVFVGLMVLGAVAGNSGGGSGGAAPEPAATSAPGGSDAPTAVPTAEPTDVPTEVPTTVPVVQVGILTLAQQYDANKLRAQAYYKDRVIETTGVANDISQDILGSYYVSLRPGGDYYGLTQVQCYVADQDQLTSVTNGQHVSVRGRVDEMTLGVIPLKDCTVVQ